MAGKYLKGLAGKHLFSGYGGKYYLDGMAGTYLLRGYDREIFRGYTGEIFIKLVSGENL